MTRTEIFRLYRSTVENTVSRWLERCATLPLNDLSEAYGQIDDFETIADRARDGLGTLRGIVDDDLYDEIESGIEDLAEAAREMADEIQSMVDDGMADDEYEDEVLDRMEDEILPRLEGAINCYAQVLGAPAFRAVA